MVHSIPSWMVWAEIECKVMLPVALPKQPLNQFKPVQQIREEVLRAYCPIVCTVPDWSFLCISVTQQGSSLQISFSISRRVLFLFNEKKSIRIQSMDFLYTLHWESLICSRIKAMKTPFCNQNSVIDFIVFARNNFFILFHLIFRLTSAEKYQKFLKQKYAE